MFSDLDLVCMQMYHFCAGGGGGGVVINFLSINCHLIEQGFFIKEHSTTKDMFNFLIDRSTCNGKRINGSSNCVILTSVLSPCASGNNNCIIHEGNIKIIRHVYIWFKN